MSRLVGEAPIIRSTFFMASPRMPTSPSASATQDIALMRQIAERDPLAMRALYDKHAGLVYAVALKVLKNRDDADELVADVFVELWDKASRYDQTRAAPSTYIVTLARSRCIDRLRRRSSRPMLSIDSVEVPRPINEATPARASEQAEQERLVRQALDSLDINQRQAVESAYYLGLTHTEIAEQLNKPLGTVKTYIRQGLIRLRDALRKTDREIS